MKQRPHKSTKWLKRDLLLWLMLPLLGIFAVTGALGTYTAHRLTNRVFDRWLLDSARSVGALVHFERGTATLKLPPIAQFVLLYDDIDNTYFSVMQGTRLLAGSAGIPGAGENDAIYPKGSAYESNFNGESPV